LFIKGIPLRVPDRLVQHTCVAVAAVLLPLLAPRAIGAASGGAPQLPRLDAVQASAAIERPAGPLFTEPPAQLVRVVLGETLESLAATFHVDAATLRWANDVRDLSEPRAGAQLIVPPQRGVLVRVPRTEPPSRLAVELGLYPRVILDYNALLDDTPLPEGSYIQVPQAIAPESALSNAVVVPEDRGIPGVPSDQMAGPHDVDSFPYGQCTYYVTLRRHVTWGGNAGGWLDAAHAAGRPIGHVPVAGAIAVTWGSWFGHVAFVERVNPDGSFVVSEWNVRGWAVYDQRTLSNALPVIGFIY
jgi:surface antigen